jgi:hypothetical protein
LLNPIRGGIIDISCDQNDKNTLHKIKI